MILKLHNLYIKIKVRFNFIGLRLGKNKLIPTKSINNNFINNYFSCQL